jgi:hypothetical protein
MTRRGVGIPRHLSRASRFLPFASAAVLPFMQDWRLAAILVTVLLVHAVNILRDVDEARTAAIRDKRLRELVRRESASSLDALRREAERRAETAERQRLAAEVSAKRLARQGSTLDSLHVSVQGLVRKNDLDVSSSGLRRAFLARDLLHEVDEGGPWE